MLDLSCSFCTTRTLLEIVVAMLLENWVALLSALELEGYISCYYITSCLEFAMTWLTDFLRGQQSSSIVVQSNLDIVNKSVRPFLFTISNNSLYQM